MTETAYPLPTLNGHDFVSASQPQRKPAGAGVAHHQHGAVAFDPVQEDDGQIACICGYYDDDGWTVACDKCNRWQHQLCYYPEYEDRALPQDLQHYCIECQQERVVDIQRARARQQERREQHQLQVNGVKRQPPKSHKKKPKEAAYTNGWALDKSRHDRNSASPRDQPPPAKRPKTSHRTSDPIVNSTAKGHSRKRTATNVGHRRSLSRSPDTPIDYYSEEFLKSYRDDNWEITDANLHDSIAIANALSAWLSASEEEFRETHGQDKGEVLMRWDGQIDDIPGKAQLEITEAVDDRVRDDTGTPPKWKTVTVQESVACGAYLGELKGHVGFKEEYQDDAANRWQTLRHPEPFVFFHHRLPIYIDARNEGTELRYVRRSCQPNAKLQVLVTDSTTYHFCFMATEQIDPGVEIAVSWDTTDSLPELMGRGENSVSQRDMHKLSYWVSTVLANCGPCACQSPDSECLMARFDRRGEAGDEDDDAPSIKAPKSRKKKPGPNISPLNTNFNSRSGSEVRKVEHDDEQSDSRSASGSAGRGSVSRDITPNTHYSHTGSLSTAPELSERERKKLAKEEEMFRRQEEERSGRTSKKKRNSGGSSLNTPSATSSKQLGFGGPSRYADAGTTKQSGLPSAKPGRKPKSSTAQKTPVKTVYKTVKRPKPDYVDSEMQCDMDKEEAERRAQASPPRKPFLSTTQRLLHRCALNNARRRAPVSPPQSAKSEKHEDEMEVDSTPVKAPPSPADVICVPTRAPPPGASEDVAMTDAQQAIPLQSDRPPADEHSQGDDANGVIAGQASSSPPTSQAAQSMQEHSADTLSAKASVMHVEMPPPPHNPFAGVGTTPSVVGAITQSPAAMNPPALTPTPAAAAAIAPSPAKKKMSLSDYTKRSKAKDKDGDARHDRDSSPASVASGPIIPPLQASDSMNTVASDASAIVDDIKMEDVADPATAVAKA